MRSLLHLAVRKEQLKKFLSPPTALYEEQLRDVVRTSSKPVIGILTQPVDVSKKHMFDYTQYILEVNDNFIRWGGADTVAIPYNMPQDRLLELLNQINGVLFTGGGLELVDKSGQMHPYL